MNLTTTGRILKVCFWADVVPEMVGHRGLGKTQLVEQIGRDWIDPFTNKKGLDVEVLHLATQEITDLIGFPIKMWENAGIPVVAGVESTIKGDRMVTSWAAPCWWPTEDPAVDVEDRKILQKMKDDGASETELWLFWNRPKFLLFLDEAKRAQRDVMQAMYPLVLNKTMHTQSLPRGSRIVTADNYAGAYDVREPDEAFMSRFCHIDVEHDINAWHAWAAENGVHSKVMSFLTSNPMHLMQVPTDQKDAVVKYAPLPDPRSWDMVSRIDKYGHLGTQGLSASVAKGVKNQAIAGVVGLASATAYGAFAETTITFETVLKGEASIKDALNDCKDETEKNKVSEKMVVETSATMKNRPFTKKEGDNLKKLIVELNQKDRATAILQTIFMLKNNSECHQDWVSKLMDTSDGIDISAEIAHLLKQHSNSVK